MQPHQGWQQLAPPNWNGRTSTVQPLRAGNCGQKQSVYYLLAMQQARDYATHWVSGMQPTTNAEPGDGNCHTPANSSTNRQQPCRRVQQS